MARGGRPGYHPGQGSGAGDPAPAKSLKDQGFYHSPAWRRARRLALQRDRYLCRLKISPQCTRVATEVHHVRPLESAPELALELANLVSCCWWCHEATKQRERRPEAPPGVRVIRISGNGDREDG